jgi:hypothetical protein
MNVDDISLRDKIHVRLRSRDWEAVRSTVRMPLESCEGDVDEALSDMVDFPALTIGQWDFLRPELDRLGIQYDYINYSVASARWVTQLPAPTMY